MWLVALCAFLGAGNAASCSPSPEKGIRRRRMPAVRALKGADAFNYLFQSSFQWSMMVCLLVSV